MRRFLLRFAALTAVTVLACLAILNFSEVSVYGATPTASFYARRDYSVFPNSNFVKVADADGDGIPDLIARQGASIQILPGNGDGTFRTGPATTTIATGAYSFQAVDLNADHKIDLALANGSGIVIATGNGDGTFQTGVAYPVNDTQVAFLVAADFNGDNVPDLAASGNSGVWLLIGKGDGTFQSPVLAASLRGCTSIAYADFNADGSQDLVVARSNGGKAQSGAGFSVLIGNGNGTFQPAQLFGQPIKPLAITVGSLTTGGPASIVVTDSATQQVYLYYGNGAGGFKHPQQIALAYWTGVAIGDVNGDGHPDLVSDDGYVAYGQGGGSFGTPVHFLEAGLGVLGVSGVQLADLRNNGLTDIVVASSPISVLVNTNNKGFEEGVSAFSNGGASCAVKGDFNGDGKPDLVISNTSGIFVLLGTGTGAAPFRVGSTINLASIGCPVAADINRDGILDLLIPGTQAIDVYLGNGDGTFTAKASIPVTPLSSPSRLVVADFNHDGKLDFASTANVIALGNGDGTFQTPIVLWPNATYTTFGNLVTGDIDNDGWPDLVLTSGSSTGSMYVLINNQQGGFTQVLSKFVSAGAIQPILADMDANGFLDLVLLYHNGKTGVFLGDGKGHFVGHVTFDSSISGIPTNAVADLNGDGILDLAFLQSGTLEIHLGTGGANFASPFNLGAGGYNPGAILVENLHGQPKSAGLPDIVAADVQYGVLVLLNLTP